MCRRRGGFLSGVWVVDLRASFRQRKDARKFFTGTVEKGGGGAKVFPRWVLGVFGGEVGGFFYKILDLYLSVWDFCLPLHSLAGREGVACACGPRELSSAGSERLPYKQRVGGSNPSAPTVFPARGGEGRKEKRGESREKDAESKAPERKSIGRRPRERELQKARRRKETKTPLFFEKKDILISSGA